MDAEQDALIGPGEKFSLRELLGRGRQAESSP